MGKVEYLLCAKQLSEDRDTLVNKKSHKVMVIWGSSTSRLAQQVTFAFWKMRQGRRSCHLQKRSLTLVCLFQMYELENTKCMVGLFILPIVSGSFYMHAAGLSPPYGKINNPGP